MILGMDILLVSPIKVIVRLGTIWQEQNFLQTVVFSLFRITSGCLIGIAAGIILAVLAGRFRVAEILLWPYVITIKSVPIASIIILCLIWLTFNQLTVFIAFLIVFPVVYANVLQGRDCRGSPSGLFVRAASLDEWSAVSAEPRKARQHETTGAC